MKRTATKPETDTSDLTIGMRVNVDTLVLIERGLIALGEYPPVIAVLTAIRRLIPASDYVEEAEQIMQPTSMTAKIERRLRDVGIETTVWCPQASHGAYVFQAINAGNTTLALDKIAALLSNDPEIGPIKCSFSGAHGEHLTLHLAVNGGEG